MFSSFTAAAAAAMFYFSSPAASAPDYEFFLVRGSLSSVPPNAGMSWTSSLVILISSSWAPCESTWLYWCDSWL